MLKQNSKISILQIKKIKKRLVYLNSLSELVLTCFVHCTWSCLYKIIMFTAALWQMHRLFAVHYSRSFWQSLNQTSNNWIFCILVLQQIFNFTFSLFLGYSLRFFASTSQNVSKSQSRAYCYWKACYFYF